MSSVNVLKKIDALKSVASSLGLASCSQLNSAMIAQSIRRAVHISAPCKRRVLCDLVVTALSPLSEQASVLPELVDDMIENLVAMGDVLEMWTETEGHRSYMLRPAPPAFVLRKDGTFIILGVAGDEITPTHDLPVQYLSSGLRTLKIDDIHKAQEALLSFGLIELPETTWMRAPKPVSAAEFREKWMARLPEVCRPEAIADLDILDSDRPGGFYKGRWTALHKRHNGLFVARRPQLYGPKLWSLAEIRNGVVHRFVDIHSIDARFRDCDEAWRIQAAIDANDGQPQKAKIAKAGGRVHLSFSSPLPMWAVRRLAFIGDRVQPQHALLAFELPAQNLQEELNWLHARLWISHDQGG